METLGNKITLNLDGNAEVNVKGFIAPIEYTQYNFHVEWDELANLHVVEPEKQYPASVFQSFLPSESVSVGELWQIEKEGVLTLLRQLHPDPRLEMDAEDSQGLWACLRGHNDQFADIVFRVHAEFALKGGWFTPSQFAGHLVIDRTKDKIAHFQMCVPETTLNFDVGWDTIGCTDIGFCPQIELCVGTPPNDVEFAVSITQEEAERALILCFYKSEKINWVPPDQAVEIAEQEVKLIHVISINGPLADEAC
ncbi:MAG: hypothetical protein OXI43_11055 [Candidatus Poribacteria bacterium]|nr:hypothetical protein [Candidatus Poribacteria bacterium]